MSSDNLEIEVKFLVRDLNLVRRRLLENDAELESDRTYEHNIRFDNDWGGLQLQGKLLRLRQDSAARLTYKGQPDEKVESEARVREELELEVADFGMMLAILERIGFKKVQVYEKYRQTYRIGAVEVVLDEMPFGDFVEVEGGEDDILETVELLGLDWKQRCLTNYLALMAELKDNRGLNFDDLTFDNFAGIDAHAADILNYAL